MVVVGGGVVVVVVVVYGVVVVEVVVGALEERQFNCFQCTGLQFSSTTTKKHVLTLASYHSAIVLLRGYKPPGT